MQSFLLKKSFKQMATNPQALAPLYPAQEKTFSTDEWVLAKITSMDSPMRFAVVPFEKFSQLKDVNYILTRSLRYKGSSFCIVNPRIHQPCVVPHGPEKLPTRGLIKAIGSTDALVYLVDIGATAFILKKDLWPLSEALAEKPPLAYPCMLTSALSGKISQERVTRWVHKVVPPGTLAAVRSRGIYDKEGRMKVYLKDSKIWQNLLDLI